jgi:hypothetical protein
MVEVAGIATTKSLYTVPVFNVNVLAPSMNILFVRLRTFADDVGAAAVGP